eukprot:3370963-Amphidinium_carterae.1
MGQNFQNIDFKTFEQWQEQAKSGKDEVFNVDETLAAPSRVTTGGASKLVGPAASAEDVATPWLKRAGSAASLTGSDQPNKAARIGSLSALFDKAADGKSTAGIPSHRKLLHA